MKIIDTPIMINTNEGGNQDDNSLSSIKPGELDSYTDELKVSSLRKTRKSNPTPLLDAKMIK